MAKPSENKIAYLYLFFLIIALLYGGSLIKQAYHYDEADSEYYKREVILKNGELRLVFANGYITAYSSWLQFLENSGLACFFSVKGIPYASFKAIWETKQINPTSLSATCRWPGLPIKQGWLILLEDGKIKWQLSLESEEEMIINHTGVVFSFKDSYRQWFAPHRQGSIPGLGVLQQQDIDYPSGLNPLGLIASGIHEKLFPAIGIYLQKGAFLDEVSLSARRDMFSKKAMLCVSIGGREPLEIHKKQKIVLSSGEIALFYKKEKLTQYLLEMETR